MSSAAKHAHESVLLKEAIEALNIKSGGLYVDGTFGRGGHSRAILEGLGDKGRLVVIDKDPEAIQSASDLVTLDDRVSLIHGSYADMGTKLKNNGIQEVDGVLLDLGVSSPQIDSAARGFSFMEDGPLDMRMNTEQTMTAASWLNSASETEIARVLKEYGEERFVGRIARVIVETRQEKAITTTAELAALVARIVPKKEKNKHPATRTFQAIRVLVNQELDDLKRFLGSIKSILKISGRLVVISFNSLEDRIVKQFIRLQHKGEPDQLLDLPIQTEKFISVFKPIGKIIRPSAEEVEVNYRSRSAVMRVAERLR